MGQNKADLDIVQASFAACPPSPAARKAYDKLRAADNAADNGGR